LDEKYKLITALIIAIILFSFSIGAEAQEISFVINGQKASNDLKIVNGRTLVPAKIIASSFHELLIWDHKQEELKIDNENFKMVLPVNKKIAFVNSEVIPLNVKTQLLNNRVMIPLRFLQRVYGGKLSWDSYNKIIYYNSNQITNIGIEDSQISSRVVIDLQSLSKYDINLYQQPKRLVLDIKNVNLGKMKRLIRVNNGIIEQIRTSQLQVDPAITRIVIDVEEMNGYRVEEEGSKLILVIDKNDNVVTSSIFSDNQNLKYKPDSLTRRIVIDPGHGGKDPGAIGVSGIMEKNVNYQIAQHVNKLLRKENFETIMTRRNREFLSLSERAQIANELPADIFISIHANHNNQSWINGTATYAHWYASKDNWALAWYVQSEIIKRTKTKDNGLKSANFSVLRKADVPALLIETAFLSNAREERLLRDDAFQRKVAEGIVAGIKKYFSKSSYFKDSGVKFNP
jgi:N-acetylmuramoyl-L-alanine amidase